MRGRMLAGVASGLAAALGLPRIAVRWTGMLLASANPSRLVLAWSTCRSPSPVDRRYTAFCAQ
ncbi:MAG: PspC domain-containing protein [Phycisphaera sp.]|nr:MAG: PspC domain-containing protein [Phycisphaera sp.]